MMFIVLLLTACAGKDYDETTSWSQSKLLGEANSALSDNDYPNCVKYFEKLEARYPFGPVAEQSQIN